MAYQKPDDIWAIIPAYSGTGSIPLTGATAPDGFRLPVDAVTNGNTFPCKLYDPVTKVWERFTGTWNSGALTVARTTFKTSSTGSTITFAAGVKWLVSTPTMADLVFSDELTAAVTAAITYGAVVTALTFTPLSAASPAITTPVITGLREVKVAMAASDIDLNAGNIFTKTITATTTLTVSHVPASGTVGSFDLELTNGGAFTVNWWSGVKWPAGIAPSLTASGVDILTFYTHDGGTTWHGAFGQKDSR